MMEKFLNIFKIPDLRKKLIFTGLLLLVYRLGGKVPIPGIDKTALASMMQGYANSLLGLYDMFAGGFFSQASIFALGIMPYISASIIIQLLGAVIPYFQRLQKEGEEGRKKIIQITRYGTVMIASLQAVGMSVFLSSQTTSIGPVVPNAGPIFYFVTILTMVTGVVFVMWLGEQISDHGIGNGISLIIMVGIIARAPSVFKNQFIQIQNGLSNPFENILLLVLMFGITMVVVAVTTGVRKIPVQYAKRVVGRKVYGGQATHIPLRILTAGVMPIIFAQALMFIPSTIASFFPQGYGFGDWLMRVFAPTHIVYSLFFAFLIIIFTYFYTAIAFNPVDVADNMKKQGGFVPGVRPGKSTSDYIDHILTRVTLPASVFLALIAIFPTFLSGFFNVDFSLASFYGGTSLLIIVGVALDTLQQIESHLLMRHYDGFLKTGKLKGRDRRR
ncbi:MAG TPA: preprotein translocase subunit SecY [Candidatus Marinimicrobia bacterium]|nr:preprotein translocase subunit SecY [Candidatus Neomarinimicrobiota bacterium]